MLLMLIVMGLGLRIRDTVKPWFLDNVCSEKKCLNLNIELTNCWSCDKNWIKATGNNIKTSAFKNKGCYFLQRFTVNV